jgi:hypothetical protein
LPKVPGTSKVPGTCTPHPPGKPLKELEDASLSPNDTNILTTFHRVYKRKVMGKVKRGEIHPRVE